MTFTNTCQCMYCKGTKEGVKALHRYTKVFQTQNTKKIMKFRRKNFRASAKWYDEANEEWDLVFGCMNGLKEWYCKEGSKITPEPTFHIHKRDDHDDFILWLASRA